MKTIHKYTLPLGPDTWPVVMRAGAEVLSVQQQNGSIAIWAKVDPDEPDQARHFRVYGTGHPIEFDGNFLGTVQFGGGALVLHVFEVAP